MPDEAMLGVAPISDSEFAPRPLLLRACRLVFAPTRAAAANLIAEGIDPGFVHVVGNTVIDALLHVRALLARGYMPVNAALRSLPLEKKLVLVTTHRRENFGEPLRQILLALKELGEDGDKVIVLPVHLNPAVRQEVTKILEKASGVHLLEPLQYPDFVYLLARAWIVVTDSGGVQEEAPSFGLPVIIARDTTERREVIEAGFGRLVGSNFEAIVVAVREATAQATRPVISGENPFGRGDAGRKIVNHLLAQNKESEMPKMLKDRVLA